MKLIGKLRIFGRLVPVTAACLLASCAVGPNYKRPTTPAAERYTPAPLPPATAVAAGVAGAAQVFSPTHDISAQWWTLFRSPELSALIERAYAANPTIDAAVATLKQTQENVYAQRGFYFPSVQANYNRQRNKVSGNTASSTEPGIQGNGEDITQSGPAQPITYNFHTAELTVGFAPDVFGGNRRQVESLQAQASVARFQLEAAYVTLASNVVAAAIQEASVRAQIAAAQEIIDSNTHLLEILREQLRLGSVTRLDVAAQESALAQVKLLLPTLEKQLEQTRDLVRVLAGNAPDSDVPEKFTLAALHLPEELPLALPSKLVGQRPDVLAAEAQVRSASAQVGVAVANRLPQFSITGNTGGNAEHFSQMFWHAGTFWGVAGNVSQTIFDGGTLRHRQRASEQALAQAAAQYRSTVLSAFQNVADTLHALYSDADALKAAGDAERAAALSLAITRKQFELGSIAFVSVLNAEQTYQQARIGLVQAQAARLTDTAALFQALGGGWWNRR